jgi:hypothetical protein
MLDIWHNVLRDEEPLSGEQGGEALGNIFIYENGELHCSMFFVCMRPAVCYCGL